MGTHLLTVGGCLRVGEEQEGAGSLSLTNIWSQIFEHNCLGGADPDVCQIFDHRYLSTTAQVALIQMKEKEISAIAAKIEDEQSLGSKMQKQVDDDGVYDDMSYNDDWWLNYDD